MRRFHVVDNRDYNKLSWAFNSVAYDLGKRLSRNPTYDERGLTDALFDGIIDWFSKVSLYKNYIHLVCRKPSEKSTGADILFRVILNKGDVHFDRYVLIQAKKYLNTEKKFSETNENNTHLAAQVRKMHSYNPEFSYILLYSKVDEPLGDSVKDIFEKYTVNYLTSPDEYLALVNDGRIMSVANYQASYPVCLLRSKTWEKMKNITPQLLLNYSEILPDFILNDLLNGKIGKEWDNNIDSVKGEFSIYATLTYGTG